MSVAAIRSRSVRQIGERLRSLAPAEVAVAACGHGDEAVLLPEESAYVAGASDARQREFALGRTCARHAMRQLGSCSRPIHRGGTGAPVWPEGLVGSISHSLHVAVAAVGLSPRPRAIGVDVESVAGVDAPMCELIAARPELDRAARTLDAAPLTAAGAIFSAKEAVYKCISPASGGFVDFLDLSVRFEIGAAGLAGFTVHPAGASAPDKGLLSSVRGRCAIVAAHHISLALIPC